MIGGGSILTVIAVVLISQLTGVDLSSMLGAQQQNGATRPTASSIDTSVCTSGDSANKYTQCRMVATAAAPAAGGAGAARAGGPAGGAGPQATRGEENPHVLVLR